MSSDLEKALESYGRVFGSRSIPPTPLYGALQEFYNLLRDISTGKLVADPEIGNSFEHLPRPLRTLGQFARNAFFIRNPFEMNTELRQMLGHLEAGDSWRRMPEARLLILKGRYWLNRLHNSEPGRFSDFLAPSFALEVTEEGRLTVGDLPGHETLLTLAWLYEGRLPASDVHLFYRAEEGVQVLVDVQEGVQEDWSFIKLADGVPEGSTCLGRLCLRHTGACRLRFRLQYINYLPQKTRLFTDESVYSIDDPNEPTELKGINPFVPDSPLSSDSDWSALGKGYHPQIIGSICADLRSGSHLFVVRGLRSSGKTTILYGIRRVLADDSGTLPVYINIYDWWLELQKQGKNIDRDGLLYHIAEETLHSADRFGLKTFRSDEFFRVFEEKLEQEPSDFEKLIRRFREETDRYPVFLLDNLDSWLEHEQFSPIAALFLNLIRDLVDQGRCSAVASHTWTGGEWDERLEEIRVFPLGFRVEMLEKPDVLALIELLPASHTAMARELIWRLSGGWPGLIQLILYCISQKVQRDGVRVDTTLVKKVIRELLNSPDWKPSLTYLLGSFQKDEAETLRLFVDQKRINLETSEISGVRFDLGKAGFDAAEICNEEKERRRLESALISLAEKQVIEPLAAGHGRFRLRVGFLSYSPISDLLSVEVQRRP